jgi:glycine/D-amino acid oxidase-like deaminating enzyme
MVSLPKFKKYVIIGAGMHGLSTAWHLAKELKARGKGTGDDIVVLDKTAPGAGASGIACGIVRNFYFQPAMGEVMRVSVDVWEENAEAFDYHGVGYIAVVGSVQDSDLAAIYERQQKSGYRSELIQGEQEVFNHMKGLLPDWKARGLTTCLHEKQGGFAFNINGVKGLLAKVQGEGVSVISGVEVTGFEMKDGGVSAVKTNQGDIQTEQVVVGVGPWVKTVWTMLGLPNQIDIRKPDGSMAKDWAMWTYWRLQEGEINLKVDDYVTTAGDYPPVIHIDSSEPLISDMTGKLITDKLWGIYFKRDHEGVQGGAMPENLGQNAQIDPYGEASPYYTVKEDFVDFYTAGLAHCLSRFEGCSQDYHWQPSGGVGAFTADSFPVFDRMLPNVYVIADSNHGYKMIGVGKEVARVLMGEHSSVLHPFRFGRFAEGDLHPVSNSPYPWS